MSMTESDLNIRDDGASARRMRAEREAVRAISTAALEGGVVADAFALLAEIRGALEAPRFADGIDAAQAVARIDDVLKRAKAR